MGSHRIRTITSAVLVGGPLYLVCECGWAKTMTRLHDVIEAHARHVTLMRRCLDDAWRN